MIDVFQRRLNKRFYRGAVTYRCGWKTSLGITPPLIENVFQTWQEKLDAVAGKLAGNLCEGEISATVMPQGYLTEGVLYVFEDTTLKHMRRPITEFFNFLSASQRVSQRNFEANVVVSVHVKAITLITEGVTVPFEELDTEPVEKPTNTTQVMIPDPTMN